MKLEVYGEKEDSTVRLKLEHRTDHLIVVAVYENGDVVRGGYLLEISEDGIRCKTHVNKSFGFDLDEDGRLKVL